MANLDDKLKELNIEKIKLEIENLKKLPNNKLWNSLEILKFMASLLIPITIFIGTCNFRKADEANANDTRIVALRFEKYEKLSEHLNNIYAYFTYKGQWKELTPFEVIHEKRLADKIQNIYSFLFSDTFNVRYKRFIGSCFLEGGGGWGKDALLRTDFANRKIVKPTTRFKDSAFTSFTWNEGWDSLFITMYPDKVKKYPLTTLDSDKKLNSYGKMIETTYKDLTSLIANELKTNISH